MDEVFEANQRIELNRFGMSLRKIQDVRQGLKLFFKAWKSRSDDEHLQFNLAGSSTKRAPGQCRKHLLRPNASTRLFRAE